MELMNQETIAPELAAQSKMSPRTTERTSCSSCLDNDKLQKLRHCLSQEPVSLWDLRELALSKGGLLTAEIRRKAWPLLVGLHDVASASLSSSPQSDTGSISNLSEKDRGLMNRDSSRSSLSKFDILDLDLDGGSDDEGTSSFDEAEKSLFQILESTMEVAPRYGTMHYYQGLHDIAGVLLVQLKSPELATAVLRQLCHSHLREALKDDNFVSLLNFLQTHLLPLLHKFDAELHHILADDDVMLPAILFPWILTWFTHDLSDPHVSSRLIDALLCGHSTLVIYLVLALLIRHREQLLECARQEYDDPIMVAMMVKTLSSRIVSDYNSESNERGIPAQKLIDDALVFMKEVSPRSIPRLSAKYHGIESSNGIKSESSFYFRAAPSWAVASFPDHSVTLTVTDARKPVNSDRAKVASGMTTRRIRPRRHRSSKEESGKDDGSSVASSTCSTRSSKKKRQARRGLYRNWWHQSY